MTKQEFVNRVMPMKDKLFRLAGRILNEADAEDIVQDVFVKLWTRKAEILKYRSPEAFAVVITRNLCLDKIKSKSYRRDDLAKWNEPVDNKSPEKMAELKNDVDMVRHAIASLPEQQRVIIQLRDIEEMDFEEISEALNMNVNTIRVNLSRARKTIRNQIKKMHDYGYIRD
jgi:RNA polymerase sigma factor (sigma-70 family)